MQMISFHYLINKIKDVKIKDYFSVFPMITALILKPFYRERYQGTWLICEEPYEARDNGYHFFRYMCERQPQQKCYYAVKKESVDAKKVQKIVIVREDNQLRTKFNEQENVIERNVEILKESRGKDRDFEKIRYYFNRYEFLMEIKRIFNYVYLPLNRSSVVYDFDNEDNMFFYRRNRAIYVDDSFEEPINKDLAK